MGVKENSDIWWIRNNKIIGIQIYTIGGSTNSQRQMTPHRKPRTLTDMQGPKRFLKMVAENGDTWSVPLSKRNLKLLEIDWVGDSLVVVKDNADDTETMSRTTATIANQG